MYVPNFKSDIFFEGLKKKILIFTLLVTAGFAILTVRLWHLTIMQHSTLQSRAENNRVRELVLDGLRGKILERNGIALVDNRPSFQLSMIPEDMSDPEKTLTILSGVIDIDVQATLKELKHANPFRPITLKRDIGRKEVAFVEERRIDLPGIFLEVKPIRRYINGELGAHMLGYLGAITPGQLGKTSRAIYSRDDFLGQYGIEKIFEKTLRGGKGMKLMEVDAAGRELRKIGRVAAPSGHDLQLTIDYNAQKAAEEAFIGKMGAAVAIDPNNGDVLAFVSKPSFDPNTLSFGINHEEWKNLVTNEFHPLQNRAIQGQYPPGSTFKIVVAAAALSEGVITPETTIFCPGSFTLGRRTYRCWKKYGHGAMNVHTALVQSCDVFFYNVGLTLGINTIAKYAKMFGLGTPTGIVLKGEKPGLVPTTKWKEKNRKEPWIIGETVSCSIGQGYMLATPIQMAGMIAVVANGGKIVRPRIIKRDDNEVEEQKGTSPISKETFDILRRALKGVVYEPHGTAWRLKQGPNQYAGKTGTAQVIQMKQNEEWDQEKVKLIHRDHALFVSYAPADNPRIAVAVVAEHSGHGGEMAAPVAQAIIDAYLGDNRDETVAGEKEKTNGDG